jgi:hypothetical protein
MVDTKEREVVYTTDADTGPSTALVVIFSLLIVAVLGFMIYYFSNANLNNAPSIIQHDTSTTTTVPVPVPSPSPAPSINITPPSAPSLPASGDSTPSTTTTP